MPWAQLLSLLRAGGPKLLAALPKLWPLLLDAKTRNALFDAAKNLGSQSPTKRLHAKVDTTVAIADGYASEATDAGESTRQARAEEWVRRGRNLSRRLDMPMQGKAARDNRRAVKVELGRLQEEMAVVFGGGGSGNEIEA